MNASSSLSDELMSQLQGAPLQQLAQQLGTDTAQTQQAVGAALIGQHAPLKTAHAQLGCARCPVCVVWMPSGFWFVRLLGLLPAAACCLPLLCD